MFTRLGQPMNRYTFVYFRKPKCFHAQIGRLRLPDSHSRTSRRLRSDFFAKICRRNFEISELKNDEIQKEHTHTQ